MSALTVEHQQGNGYGWQDLLRIWEATDAPEGCRVEIIEGIVTVAPPPSKEHNLMAHKLQKQLYPAIPDGWGIYQTLGLTVPSRNGLYIPDLVVLPEAALSGPGYQVPADEAELVVEITSPGNGGQDRVSKPAGYAAAGVPLYLLVDGWAPGGPTVTLYGQPNGDVYRTLRAVTFGEDVPLPEPFGISLDTSGFPAA
ncbi:Uma2 family endonuclease [Streptomyces sp. ACA25]|uniref:Uma2 family endonuclease n=1 Tax=Streptomyces sp. ACA25 TaxID=3022596 RepID=UPI002306EC81|nr:Uma2 family endonuclease [Streptomyces sp. ACA25]MDB1087972.1 Uma2 family endonuclease [Streptomyces sp. ACA25]